MDSFELFDRSESSTSRLAYNIEPPAISRVSKRILFIIKRDGSFKDNFPDIAKEWHPTKNGGTTPKEVTRKSNQKVWWLGKCRHEYQALISSRANGSGCPVCCGKTVLKGFNDLATTFPDVAKEWHQTKNDNLTPEDVTCGANKKVWWLDKCGHEYEAMILNRTYGGTGCPACSREMSKK